MRQPRSLPPTLSRADVPRQTVLADLKLQVVTPMFGGGVNPGEVDDNDPIRASAIRGHLRFWWRACNAGRFETLQDMWQEEERLWGSATKQSDPNSGPGAISIRVSLIPGDKQLFTYQEIEVRRRDGSLSLRDDGSVRTKWIWRCERDSAEDQLGPDYALFPFTPQPGTVTSPRRDSLPGRVDIGFRLRLTLAPHVTSASRPSIYECQDAARQALWAWITFGGVGARTRRGCGTLRCHDDAHDGDPCEHQILAENFRTPDQPADIGPWLEKHLVAGYPECVVSGSVPVSGVSSLVGCRIAIGAHEPSPVNAWDTAVKAMQEFTQGPRIARFPGSGGRPGESWWPEVSAAREVLSKPDPPHAIANAGVAGRTNFPRADLGLPRLIKVRKSDSHGKPLQGKPTGFQRLASPIILKALPIGNHSVSLAVELTAPHVWDPGTPDVVMEDEPVTVGPMSQIVPDDWPFADDGHTPPHVEGAVSARDAFMTYLRLDCDWTEVIL